jgi:hypothetical protein
MSMSAIGRIGAKLANLTLPQPLSRAVGVFRRGFSNSPTAYKPLSSQSARVEQAPKAQSQPQRANSEMRAKFEAARRGTTFSEVTAFLDYVHGRVQIPAGEMPDNTLSDVVYFALSKECFTTEEIDDVLKNVEGAKWSKADAIVLEVLKQIGTEQLEQTEVPPPPRDQKTLMREMATSTEYLPIKKTIDSLAEYFSLNLPPDRQKSDAKFRLGVLDEFYKMMKSQDQRSEFFIDDKALADFVENAKRKSVAPEGRGAIVLEALTDIAEVRSTINEIVHEIEENRLPEKHRNNDDKFNDLIDGALKEKGPKGKALREFVKKAAGVVQHLEGRHEAVLRKMHFKSKSLW